MSVSLRYQALHCLHVLPQLVVCHSNCWLIGWHTYLVATWNTRRYIISCYNYYWFWFVQFEENNNYYYRTFINNLVATDFLMRVRVVTHSNISISRLCRSSRWPSQVQCLGSHTRPLVTFPYCCVSSPTWTTSPNVEGLAPTYEMFTNCWAYLGCFNVVS